MVHFVTFFIVSLAFLVGYEASRSNMQETFNINQLLTEVDWRKLKVVSRVKDQGRCGACWAFASTGVLEAQWALKTKKLTELSEQNLLDCSWKFGNRGCYGGWMENSFKYIIKNHGIDTEQSYPYLGKNSFCHYNPKSRGATASKLFLINNETALETAVATVGPVAVAMDVSRNFYKYSGGVFEDDACDGDEVNHAMLVVGYGVEEGIRYWLLKNSWGPRWGENGYVRVVRGKDLCGVGRYGSYAVV